jgi:hypothetical protein
MYNSTISRTGLGLHDPKNSKRLAVNDAGSASFGDPSIVSSRDNRHFQGEMWSLCSDRRCHGPCFRSGLADSGLPPMRTYCWVMMCRTAGSLRAP